MRFFGKTFNFDGIKNFGKKVVGGIKQIGKAVNTGLFDALRSRDKEQATLTGRSRLLAIISKEAYKKPQDRSGVIESYHYEPNLSAVRWAIYKSDVDHTVIIGFRGTADLEDVVTDVSIIKGNNQDSQVREADDVYKKALEHYPSYKVIVTGHSKGGYLAYYLNQRYGVPAEVFNGAITPVQVTESNPYKDAITFHIIGGDAVSNLAKFSGLGHVKEYASRLGNDALSAHRLDNFV